MSTYSIYEIKQQTEGYLEQLETVYGVKIEKYPSKMKEYATYLTSINQILDNSLKYESNS